MINSQLLSATGVTDRGFTSHKENRGIGLTFMNARYYSPNLGRFLSADTIIPDPGSSQAYNRYAYVSNNPIRFTDPSGHCGAESNNDSDGYLERRCNEVRNLLEVDYGVTILGSWSLNQIKILQGALQNLLTELGHTVFNHVFNGLILEVSTGDKIYALSEAKFNELSDFRKNLMATNMVLRGGCNEDTVDNIYACEGLLASYKGNRIAFGQEVLSGSDALTEWAILHELGHRFDDITKSSTRFRNSLPIGQPQQYISDYAKESDGEDWAEVWTVVFFTGNYNDLPSQRNINPNVMTVTMAAFVTREIEDLEQTIVTNP